MINFKLKKTECCPVCRSSNLKKISLIKNKIINSRIKEKLFLIECNICSHRTFSKIPQDSQLKKAYENKDPLVWGALHNEPKRLKNKYYYKFTEIEPLDKHWIFKYIDINEKKTFFELGPGAFNLYKTFYKKGWKCTGIEPNTLVKAPGIKENFNSINTKADVSVAIDVLEHVHDPMMYLKKISSITKKKGKIFLTFPNSQSFKSIILKDKWSMVEPFAHLNFFSKTSTTIMLKKAKFKVVSIQDFCYVDKRRLFRNILKLPMYLIRDLFSLNLKGFIERIKETTLNILDLINGDQLKVVAIKL